MLSNLARRVRMIVARSVVNLINDALMIQCLQVTVLADDVAQVQRFQNYGLTSVPLVGAEAIVASISGARSHLVAIAVDDGRYRLKNLAPGEVALYTNEGDVLHFKNGRLVELTAGTSITVTAPEVTIRASTKVTLDTPEVDITGKLNVTGDIATNGSVTAQVQVTANGVTLTSRAAA